VNEPFKDVETAKTITMPMAMRYALRVTATGQNMLYDPHTQISVFGGDATKVMGSKDQSTCPMRDQP